MPSGPVKHRNPKIANAAINIKVTMKASFPALSNHTHCKEPDLARYLSW